MEEKKKEVPRLQTQKKLGGIIGRHYAEAHERRKTGKGLVAYCGTAVPSEMLWAMDILTLYPEAHSGTCSARRVSTEMCEVAEAHDFDPQLCGLARTDVGSHLMGEKTTSPMGGLAKPDFIVVQNSYCDMIQFWFAWLARYYKVPLYVLDVPQIHKGTNMKEVVAHVKRQLLDIISSIEEQFGVHLDYDRLKEVCYTTQKSNALYSEFLDLNKHAPAPLQVFDQWMHNFPILCRGGYEETVDYYQELVDELKGWIRLGISSIPEEKYRLYWDNLISWFVLGRLAKKLSDMNAPAICGIYSPLFRRPHVDPNRPIDSIVEDTTLFWMNYDLEAKTESVIQMLKDYSVDGCVWYFFKTCKPFDLTQNYIRDQVTKRLGLPGTRIESDVCDERAFSESETYMRLEALVEEVAARKK